MVVVALALAVGMQQPQVTVDLDRTEVVVGEEMVFTITVTSPGSLPVTITDPPLDGLSLVAPRERSRVSFVDGAAIRVSTRELTLRATRPGTATIGPVRVGQGEFVVATEPSTVRVQEEDPASLNALSPRARAMLGRAPPRPRTDDEVQLSVVASATAARVGEQVDVIVVAWFPRQVRSRLRNPPTLAAPEVRGGWADPRPTPIGTVMSREIGGRWYDAFVLHEVVFPLKAGDLEVGPAKVSYSVPLSGSFLSRELRREALSEPFTIAVRGLPPPDRAGDFTGATGQALNLRVDVSTRELRVGDAARVLSVLSGVGNVALWPEPTIAWPPGIRAYRQDVEIDLVVENGVVGGSKAYEYLVVADSAGTHRVPPLRYVYFDTRASRYETAQGDEMVFVTPEDAVSVAPLRTVQPLLTSTGVSLGEALVARVPFWTWLILFAVPPLLAAYTLGVPGQLRARAARPAVRVPAMSELDRLEAEFIEVLERLLPSDVIPVGGGLADSLRAAGVDPSLAAHAARVRDRLRQARYGPDGSGDPEELGAEVQEVRRALGGTVLPASRAKLMTAVLAVLLVIGGAIPLSGQAPEQLYEAGAVRLAADSFAARTRSAPLVAAHWYNLGNAWQRLGEEARARAAWLRAARLAPRRDVVRRALEATPAPGPSSGNLTWVSPVTPGEAIVGGLTLWIVAWVAIARRWRRRTALAVALVAVLLSGYGGYVRGHYSRPIAVVLQRETPLRSAPYGRASAATVLDQGAAVRLERAWGRWLLVRSGREQGWLLNAEVVKL